VTAGETGVAEETLDLVGVGIGPFNLSVAALASAVPGLRTAFLEREREFRWHPGLLIEGATIQVPFLADLVSLVRPAHPLSFLAFLAEHDRLFPFYFAERLHVDRAEYDAYCRWAAERLPSCRFGHEVTAVRWSAERNTFLLEYTSGGSPGRLSARNVVFGVGTAPSVPGPLRALVADPGELVLHSADYLGCRERLAVAGDVVVVGSGQSGAEVFLDLLRRRPPGRERLRWFARTPAIAPMEYSKLGLEHFTPDYTAHFRGLPAAVRGPRVDAQWQLYKGIDAGTIAAIHDELYRRSVPGGWPDVTITPGVAVTGARSTAGRVELDLRHGDSGEDRTVRADGVVLATGYTERPLTGLLPGLDPRPDGTGRAAVSADYRLDLGPAVTGSVFVQNAERHTHGVGSPDLGLGAWRAAVILNAVSGRPVFRLPARTAFTTFGWDGRGPGGAT
jgi:lysine N6-hydroxylase